MRVFVFDNDTEVGCAPTDFVRLIGDLRVGGTLVSEVTPQHGETVVTALRKALQEQAASDAALLLVHLEDSDWSGLVNEIGSTHNAVRFTGGNWKASPPLKGQRGGYGFACCKPKSSLAPFDIVALIQAFGSAETLEKLREGNLPDALLGLLSFEPIEKLHVLNILLQGWVANPDACTGECFRAALLQSDAGDWTVFWKAVGREMGLVENREQGSLRGCQPHLATFLTTLHDKPENVSGDLVERASKELKAFLARAVG